MHRRSLAAALAATTVILALAALAIVASPAPDATAAAGTCKGSLLTSVPAKRGDGRVVARLGVYYNRSTGVKCAVFQHVGPTYGKRLFTHVDITRCVRTTSSSGLPYCSPRGTTVKNEGRFTTYAGPVKIRAKGSCIRASGYMKLSGGGSAGVDSLSNGVFCG